MSHYFSRVQLISEPLDNPWLRALEQQGEAYRDHALIWRLFPGDGEKRDFLFRRLDDGRTYYVVSARLPEAGASLFRVQTKPYQPQLAMGECLQFELRANPTVSLREPDRRMRRHDVIMHAKRGQAGDMEQERARRMEEAGRNWLLQRAEQWGLSIESGSVLQKAYCQHRLKRKGGTGRSIAFSSVDYQGLARVTDPERLQQAMTQGVGHAKGFGCGLLLVKRMT